MPTFHHGKKTYFSIQDSGGVVRNITDGLRSISFPRQSDAVETTAFGSSNKTYVVGIPGATIDIDGMFDSVYDGYLAGLLGFDTPRNFLYGPQGTSAQNGGGSVVRYAGQVLMTSYQVQGSFGDMVAVTASFVITGAITRTVATLNAGD